MGFRLIKQLPGYQVATGITLNEMIGEEAKLAVRTHQDPNPLPLEKSRVELVYPNKCSYEEILKPIELSFSSIKDGGIRKVDEIPINSFVLSDNFFGLHDLIRTGKKATLIYIDPPYGTGLDFHSRDLQHAYKDNMCPAAYLEYMRRRLILMREVLSDDGTIYLHIGHQMLAHIKVLMDEIFGASNFRNIITRRKCSSKNFTKNQYANIHDYILFYSKSANYKWNKPGVIPDKEWIDKEYPKLDDRGRYKLVPIHAPGTRKGETGKPWRGKMPPPGKHWQYAPSKLDELDANKEIHWSSNGNPRRKVYLTKDKKLAMTDYWAQFRDAYHQSIKITGYPTEKNFDMLKLIVEANSDEGDLVIDPFCGSGTTIHAAKDLGRSWIGMDQSFTAAKTVIKRFNGHWKAMGDFVKRPAAQCQLDLEANRSNASPPSDYSFIVDSWLADDYRDELLEMVFNESL